jgi:hypothetical protein
MKVFAASLLVIAAANSHDKITKDEFDSESQGKWVFLDMYAEW